MQEYIYIWICVQVHVCVYTHGAWGQSCVLPIEMAFCLLGDRLSLAWSVPIRLNLLDSEPHWCSCFCLAISGKDSRDRTQVLMLVWQLLQSLLLTFITLTLLNFLFILWNANGLFLLVLMIGVSCFWWEYCIQYCIQCTKKFLISVCFLIALKHKTLHQEVHGISLPPDC